MALSNPEMNEVETMKEASQDEEPIPKEPELGTFEAIHMIIAPMEIPAGIFDEAQTGITWVPMLKETSAQVAEFVIDQLDQVQPRCITIMALQNAFKMSAVETVEEIKSSIDLIVGSWHLNQRHRVVIASLVFVPNDVEEWGNIADANAHIMRANKSMKMQPLRIHRIFLSKQKGQGVQVVNGGRFLEFKNNQGLGATPTMESLKLMVKWLLMHHKKGMYNTEIPDSCEESAGMQPTPLGFTDGYCNNPDMRDILAQRGQFVSRRSRSSSRKRETPKKPAKRVTSAEQGRTPRKQRINSVGSEPPAQILVREMSEAYRQNADMYRLDQEKEKKRENDRLEAVYLMFHEKSQKLREVEKRYQDLLFCHTSDDGRNAMEEVRRLKQSNRRLGNENDYLRDEVRRQARKIQDLGRDYDDVWNDLKEWKKRAQQKVTRKVEWSAKKTGSKKD